jgi:phosphate transport system permease protein
MNQPSTIPLISTVVREQPGPTEPDKPPVAKISQPSAIRSFLRNKTSGKFVDGSFHTLMVVCAMSIFFIVVLIVWVLVAKSKLSIHAFGFKFFTQSIWDPVSGEYGALPFI